MTENAAESVPDTEAMLGRLWERNYDPATQGIIENLPLEPHWRCLDVGAGLGSMSYWMSERAHRGSVLALDVETHNIDERRAPNLSVRRADVTEADFEPHSFDLVLFRAVLSYLSDPEELVARAARWLSPGGWMVAEDFYFMPSEDGPSALGRKVVDAYTKGASGGGMDMRMARRLPAMLSGAGLGSVDLRLRPLGPGQGAEENELMRRRMELQGQPLVDEGLLTSEEISEFNAMLERPEVRDVTTLQFSVWGQRTA